MLHCWPFWILDFFFLTHKSAAYKLATYLVRQLFFYSLDQLPTIILCCWNYFMLSGYYDDGCRLLSNWIWNCISSGRGKGSHWCWTEYQDQVRMRTKPLLPSPIPPHFSPPVIHTLCKHEVWCPNLTPWSTCLCYSYYCLQKLQILANDLSHAFFLEGIA